jgi:hypothetical protein
MMSGTGALRQFVPKAVRQHFQKRNALWASRAGRGRAARTMADSDAGVGSGGTDAHVRDDGRHCTMHVDAAPEARSELAERLDPPAPSQADLLPTCQQPKRQRRWRASAQWPCHLPP